VPRVVLDTNVLTSAAISPEGTCARLIDLLGPGGIFPIVSEALLGEYRRVLSRPHIAKAHRLSHDQIESLIRSLAGSGSLVELGTIPPVIEVDPADDIVVATATAGNAEFVVSGDKRLLDLGSYQGVEVLPPVAMLAILNYGEG
jgi:putative PIN family toxin of toxin-antitoxin system